MCYNNNGRFLLMDVIAGFHNRYIRVSAMQVIPTPTPQNTAIVTIRPI